MHTYHDIIACCMNDMVLQMYSKISHRIELKFSRKLLVGVNFNLELKISKYYPESR